MKVIVTGGGTAGHVTPLLAVVSELAKIKPGVKITYIGTNNDVNSSLIVDSNSITLRKSILAGKFRRYNGKSFFWYIKHPSVMLLNLRDLFYVFVGLLQSILYMVINRPDVIFVSGGYVGLPVGLAGALLRVPLITNDLDTHPGLTNRILSKHAKSIVVAAPLFYYPQYKNLNVFYCGVPVRKDFIYPPNIDEAKKKLNLNKDTNVIVFTGGSSGASKINKLVFSNLSKIINKDNLVFYWLCGSKEYNYYKDKVKGLKQVIIKDFEPDMVNLLSSASLVITRAGATTLAEIASLAKPMIIIPSKMLTGGHQIINAKIYEDSGSAIVLDEDKILSYPNEFVEAINNIIGSKKIQNTLSNNAKKIVQLDSANKIAKIIIDAANKRN